MQIDVNPQPTDAVLGSGQVVTDVVLGGHDKLLGKLFHRFNNEAVACNKLWLRLELSSQVALTRHKRRDPFADLNVKVIREHGYWEFAGFIKHHGSLFGNTAFYVPSTSERELRKIALPVLLGMRGIRGL